MARIEVNTLANKCIHIIMSLMYLTTVINKKMHSQKEEQKINLGKYLLPLIPDVPFPCLLANKVAWPTVSFSRKSFINFFMRTTSVKLKKVKCTILKLCSCCLSITVGVFNTLATCCSVLCGKYTFVSLFTM